MSSFVTSPAGIAQIQQFEGFRATPAQLPDGNWVVGYGHVRIGEAGEPVTEQGAAELLALDLAPVERSINATIKTPLTQQQFDALASFVFSIGVEAFEGGDVPRRINSGAIVAAACAMDAWRKCEIAGEVQVVDALVRRRAAEKAQFLADAKVDASPSVLMRARLDHAASILGSPVLYAPAPQVGVAPVLPQKPEPAVRLTEILKSEPATEALLLTQVVANDAEPPAANDEIVTAHAKPVARGVPSEEEDAAPKKGWARWPVAAFSLTRSIDHVGLIALLAFGIGLVALGASSMLGGRGDMVDVLTAFALAAPGLAAVGLSSFGLWKGPAPQSA